MEFAVLGSVLRSDFRPNSDIDVLVTFAPKAKRGLTETLQLQDELKAIFPCEVDFIVKTALEKSLNRLRCQIIKLTHIQLIPKQNRDYKCVYGGTARYAIICG
ncbi:nucleotidyltransferase domain-containing protein [Microcoleus sp. FACHB-68]|uniref:nucleotidyltransferase family protein n=1 Tax=Microcoleus sp. FACHB-68 TaxID=2692826 RepID=UPI0032206EF7